MSPRCFAQSTQLEEPNSRKRSIMPLSAVIGLLFLVFIVGVAAGLSWRSHEIDSEISLRKKWEAIAKKLVGWPNRQ